MKYSKEELEKMSRQEMAAHIDDITQTPVCADKKYCDLIITIWLKK